MSKVELPKYVDEDDVKKAQAEAKPYRACDQLRYDLKMCMLNTDCVQKEHRTPRDCLKSNDPSVPQECHYLAYRFFECKTSLIDMRTRFRGRKWDS